ncbi:MAG TPA: hypothetical protein VGO47_11035 [Chlamydiales bacterium]|nr:hypothetical protein [Chlamydiales bacterium]
MKDPSFGKKPRMLFLVLQKQLEGEPETVFSAYMGDMQLSLQDYLETKSILI